MRKFQNRYREESLRSEMPFSLARFRLGFYWGGFLADYVFEPFMRKENGITAVLHTLVGTGSGSGMAVMFLCTGILGSLFSFISYHKKEIKAFG